MKKSTNIGDRLYSFFLIILLIILWQISLELGWINDYVLPYPIDIIKTFYSIRMDILDNLYITLQEAIIGLTIAIMIAVIIGTLMDLYSKVKKALFPLLLISQTVPVILLAPLFAMWFGFGITPKIIVVVITCFFPIVISLNQGLEKVDVDKVNLLKTMGASKYQIYKIVKLPSSLFDFFSGLKVAATYSFMGAVISEWMGGRKGLGIYFLRAKKSFDINRVFVVVLVIIIISILIYYGVSLLQDLTTKWQKKSSKKI